MRKIQVHAERNVNPKRVAEILAMLAQTEADAGPYGEGIGTEDTGDTATLSVRGGSTYAELEGYGGMGGYGETLLYNETTQVWDLV